MVQENLLEVKGTKKDLFSLSGIAETRISKSLIENTVVGCIVLRESSGQAGEDETSAVNSRTWT